MRQAKACTIATLAIFFIVCLGLLFPQSGQAAEKQPALLLNGHMLDLPQAITQIDQSIMIPIRVVSEQLGYQVKWEGSKQSISIQSNSHSIQLVVDNKEAIVNKETRMLDVPATVVNQTTLVPLRFVGESMGLNVKWDNDSKSVHINAPDNSSEQGPATAVKDNVITSLSYSNNTLSITSQEDATPQVTVMNNPYRIVVDYSDTVFSNQVSQAYNLNVSGQGKITVNDHANVQQIRFSVFSRSPAPNAVRFVIDMTEELSYSVHQETGGNFTLTLAPSSSSDMNNSDNVESEQPTTPNEPEEQPESVIPPVTPSHNGQYTVVIDAGHGGYDGGAPSIRNRLEKDFALATVLKVAELASQDSNLNVLLTRSEDVYPTRTERVNFANQSNADLFISIHGNSVIGMNTGPNGTETYYYRKDSEEFAKLMHSYLIAGTEFRDRGYKQANHQVTRDTTMPAILLEVGFLTNPENELQMFTEEFQWKVAEQIVLGIKAQLGLPS